MTKQIAALERMTVDELRRKYAEEFGEPTNGRNRPWLIKRIAWRMQANAEGGLAERARQRAKELARDADMRMMPPRNERSADQRSTTVAAGVRGSTQLLPGTVLTRDYKGQSIRVTVLGDGFEWEGDRYRSLTAVTRAVTGKHWNGHHFFGLRNKKDQS